MPDHDADARIKVHLDMVSDVVCPWCWLGLRRLKSAMDVLPDWVEIDLHFRPYELDPAIPRSGVDYRSYMRAKFGPERSNSRWRQMRTMLEEYGQLEGIPFDFDGIEHRPNTLDAHRLIRWAQGQDKGMEAKEKLFHAYFTEHRDIGDPAVLTEIGASVGLDPEIIEKLYATGADREVVRDEERLIRQMGVSGVPTYIAERKYAIQGAQDVEIITRFIMDVADKIEDRRV